MIYKNNNDDNYTLCMYLSDEQFVYSSGQCLKCVDSKRGRDVEIKKWEVVAERGQKVGSGGGDV